MIRKILFSLFVFALSAAAFAASSYSQIETHGVYIDGRFGYGRINGTPTPGTNAKNGDFAWGGDIGYQINPYFAFDGGAMIMPKITVDTTTASSVTAADTNYLTDVALKGLLPFGSGQRGDLYAKLGAAYMHIDMKDGYSMNGITGNKSAFSPYGAVGISWAVYPNIRIFAQAESTLKARSIPVMYLGTVGLAYYFY